MICSWQDEKRKQVELAIIKESKKFEIWNERKHTAREILKWQIAQFDEETNFCEEDFLKKTPTFPEPPADKG